MATVILIIVGVMATSIVIGVIAFAIFVATVKRRLP